MKSKFTQRTIKVKDLIPNPKNPRIDLRPDMPLYVKLKDSIEHYGYLDPIIWNKRTGMIVSGHQRFKVMKDLAEAKGEPFDEVDVMEVEMTESEQDSFMVAVNKITGLWDTEKLSALFKELSEEDLKYTGYDEFEIKSLVEDDESDIFGDDVPEIFSGNSSEIFSITFSFPSELEDKVTAIIKKVGKKEMTDLVLEKILEQGDKE